MAGSIRVPKASVTQTTMEGAKVVDRAKQVHALLQGWRLTGQASTAPHQAMEPGPAGGRSVTLKGVAF
jgi:hypothetical protein